MVFDVDVYTIGFPNEAVKLWNSIELAVRLWLMIDIQDVKPDVYRTLRTAWPWLESVKLVDVL